ncbi:MAG: aminoacyl-tRNA hydrolase [Christensenellales bacterium]|mgnify:CR=1 FL=1|jgi:PTH1 family peptidyl-tRNA hydrolase|nr:aminoacyl-tRNA hydrolase [Clostridiales bacterium]
MRFDVKKLFRPKEKKRTLIIAGLGNPGEKYEKTYHNMGYGAIDALSLLYGVKVKRAECSSLTAAVNDGGVRVILAKPITYMNLSGQAVKSLLRKYDAGIEDLIVVYDDADLTRFALRARQGGSAGAHKGMKNIVETLGRDDFKRIRIGIGKEEGDIKDYVLSAVKKEDQSRFEECFKKVARSVKDYVGHKDYERLMRELNSKENK